MSEAELEKHLDAVRRELRVRAWGAPRVDAAFRELDARRRAEGAFRRHATVIGGSALALAALFALVFLALRGLAPSDQLPAKMPAVTASFERLALGEGTEVEFDRGARLEVRERSDTRVVVELNQGKARFNVRHDPGRLFRVEAGGVTIEDLGTRFAVENVRGSVTVSVSEGSVAVSFEEQGQRKSITLEAGQEGVYSPTRAPPERAPPAAGTDGARGPAPDEPAGKPSKAPMANWRELARAGKHREAYALIAPGGFRDVRNEPSDLLLASDVARLSRHPAEAASLLRKLLASHGRDPRAPSAAFTLGWVLMNELESPREAALAFARAETLAPGGNLAEDAVARAVEAWYRAGQQARAKAELERYRKRYPKGRHRAMLERLVEPP